ncbi:discoidin domain-containing protein [Paenibacillus alvei]|uniref:Discoidin domain-containing protein n=2 Tax=Paenibacillus alvei TaxID=44250 RepID=A0AAP7A1J4_PAEAL|nr:discoidin domain-containing protein [Paenibacillus alvei]NOJ73924.1 discoidin domain-containing protein [Paenibacillus alvei]
MKQEVYSHGFDHPVKVYTTTTETEMYFLQVPINELSLCRLKSIKFRGLPNVQTKMKIAILQETNRHREYKILLARELINDGKYGDDIYYFEGIDITCPKETFLAIIFDQNTKVPAEGGWYRTYVPWVYSRCLKVNYETIADGSIIDIYNYPANATWEMHYPIEFEIETYETKTEKILFIDESGEYKRYQLPKYIDLSKANENSKYIYSSDTHINHPNSLWKVFNNEVDSGWVSVNGKNQIRFITYDFGVPTTIDRLELEALRIADSVNFGIQYWTFLGSNDNNNWTQLYKCDSNSIGVNGDDYNSSNGSHIRYVDFEKIKPTYQYYKIEFGDGYHKAAPYDFSVGVKRIGLMKFVEEGWETIGRDITDKDFITYGMSKSEVEALSAAELSQLDGDFEVKIFTEIPQSQPVLIKEMEKGKYLPNLVGDEFEILKYTENPLAEEVEFIVEDNEKKSLADYFENNVELSIYSEDGKPEVELGTEVSPLDEYQGNDIELLEYSDVNPIAEKIEKKQFANDSSEKVDGLYIDSLEVDLKNTRELFR